MNPLNKIPSVEIILRQADELIARYGRTLTLNAIRSTLDEIRAQYKKQPRDFAQTDPQTDAPSTDMILAQAESTLRAWTTPTLLPVINATGVILHTNLGRAPLSNAAIAAMNDAARGYSNLEYNLETGTRGSRLIHAEAILQKLLGVESALVVNNNASAVLLVLSALANRKRVIISRAQLVEIGGGFRVPDVMKQSGAKLVEVGTTNKVKINDYKEALKEPAALVMRAHPSNFKIIGFTEQPELKDIADAAHKANALMVDDIGSGALFDTAKYGLAHEPTVQESLAAGVDVVCFSGDKLLGGPQSGIIVGKKEALDKIKKHPLARAVRADKTCLAGISATLLHYLKDEAEREIPVLKMIAAPLKQLEERAKKWSSELGAGQIVKGESTVGGGSLPEESLPTFLLSLEVKSSNRFLKTLRAQYPPIIARTENDRILFDPRAVLPEQDKILLARLKSVYAAMNGQGIGSV